MSADLDSLYRIRFDRGELERKAAIWRVLCRDFFQAFIKPGDTVLDLACGTGEFINNIRAARRIGVDLREDSRAGLARDVEFMNTSATELRGIESGTVDAVFASNFLEHLHDKDELLAVFRQAHRVLRAGGRFLIMGPNIRCVPGAYWDFLDHHIPLTERTVMEALELCDFEVIRSIARFLPYSTKSGLPQAPWMVAAYLRFPPAWRVLGKQFFVAGLRRS